MNASNKYCHQVRISEREALLIMLALFWLGQYMPTLRGDAAHYYDVFSRVYQIIKKKKENEK